jgi:hypothetical protein
MSDTTLLLSALAVPDSVDLLHETDDTVVASSSDISVDTAADWYRAVFEDLPAGRYRVSVLDAGGSAIAGWQVEVREGEAVALCGDNAWLLALAERIPRAGVTHRYTRIARYPQDEATDTAISALP